MGAVGVVVLTLDGVQQGERPVRSQGRAGQHDLEQQPHLGHDQGRFSVPYTPGHGCPTLAPPGQLLGVP